MKKKYILLLCGSLLILNCYPQESFGGRPLMFGESMTYSRVIPSSIDSSFLQIQKKSFSLINNELEQEKANEIAKKLGYLKNQIYGLSVPVNLDFKSTAALTLLGDTGKIYLLELSSPSAYALQVYFDKFKIPKGARMFIYDKNKTMFLGSFTHQNNFVNNSFGTQFIPGNSIIIEYYEPNQVEFPSQLHIKNIVHSFSKYGPFSPNGSAHCEINVNCPTGYGWEKEKRSVAIILGKIYEASGDDDYYGWCSGAVINNIKQDGTPLFLTANHCLTGNMADPFFWLVLFNYETDSCSDDGSNVSYSTVFNSIFGGEILSQDGFCSPTSDYGLIKLNVQPSTLAKYNVVYAGWELNENKASNSPYTIGIHHPCGDVKKISKGGTPVSINHPSMGGCPNFNTLGTHWKIIWEDGVTEGGSSGSPLFNSDHKIIGQLHGGSSSCSNQYLPDYYGKFSYSYLKGSFFQWLDPYNSGATSIGSYDPSGLNDNCYNKIKDGTESDVDCGGNCPPCDWVSTFGWGVPHCYNGIKDSNETGIDCGGECRPCGGTQQCNDCKKNGDETFIDCGGSCKPCNNNCTLNYKYYLNGNEPLPNSTVVKDFIEIKGGYQTIQANKNVYLRAGNYILLGYGFTAKEGSVFTATIGDCDCVNQPCGVFGSSTFTPNGDGIDDDFCLTVVGYDRYECKIYNRWGNKVNETNGNIYDNKACLWSGGDYPTGAYYCFITYYNQCAGISKTDNFTINLIRPSNTKSNSLKTIDIFDISIDSVEIDNTPSDLNIYPNPITNTLNINYLFKSDKPYLQIIDSSGKIVLYKNIYKHDLFTVVDTSNLLKGSYIVFIMDGTKQFVKKIIKT